MALKGRILSLDPGQKKIGLALSDPTQTIAQPYATWPFNDQFWSQLKTLTTEKKIVKIVVGLPHGLRGESRQGLWTHGFIAELQKHTAIPIDKFSEVFTSKIAQKIQSQLSKKEQRQPDDALAATVLLQDYLESIKINSSK